jgi:hypothetical protein
VFLRPVQLLLIVAVFVGCSRTCVCAVASAVLDSNLRDSELTVSQDSNLQDEHSLACGADSPERTPPQNRMCICTVLKSSENRARSASDSIPSALMSIGAGGASFQDIPLVHSGRCHLLPLPVLHSALSLPLLN